jgi:hypothetical protein
MIAQTRRLEDPDDKSVVYLDEIVGISSLQEGGQYQVRIVRQSGNLQQEDRIFDDKEKAIKAAVSTFKRAKIEYVAVDANTPTEFFFRRPYHCHRGRSEGKKVAKAEIYKVA